MENDQEREAKAHWHWDRTVNLGHLLTTLSAIVAIGVMASTFHTRLAIVEQQLTTQQQVNIRVQDEFATFKADVRGDLREIIHRLDRIAEQQAIDKGRHGPRQID